MARSDSLELAFYAIVGGGFLVATGIKRFRTARKTQDTATSKIASAPQGFVEVQGYAWKNSTDTKNTDGRKCVYYKISLQKLVKSGKKSRWDTIATSGMTDPFYILDETGAISVVTENFEFNIQNKVTDWRKISNSSRELILLTFSGLTNNLPSLNPSWFFSPSYRCVESFILLGSPIIVHGNLEHSPSMKNHVLESGIKAFHSKILKYKTDKKRSLTLFDVNKDGVISEEELRIGMHSAAQVSLNNSQSEETKNDLKYFGAIHTHPSHKSFIADCHEQHLLKRIGSWNMLFIFGGAALILAGIWMTIYSHQTRF